VLGCIIIEPSFATAMVSPEDSTNCFPSEPIAVRVSLLTASMNGTSNVIVLLTVFKRINLG